MRQRWHFFLYIFLCSAAGCVQVFHCSCNSATLISCTASTYPAPSFLWHPHSLPPKRILSFLHICIYNLCSIYVIATSVMALECSIPIDTFHFYLYIHLSYIRSLHNLQIHVVTPTSIQSESMCCKHVQTCSHLEDTFRHTKYLLKGKRP